MSLLNKLKLGIAAVGLVGLLSCGGEETSNSTSGCTSNAQCKAGRVCYEGECVDSDSGIFQDSGAVPEMVCWERSYGRLDSALKKQIIQTKEGGYIFTSVRWDEEREPEDWTIKSKIYGQLTKTDKLGQVEWTASYGDGTKIFSVQETVDLGFIITGERTPQTSIIKTDKDGTKQWEFNFGSSEERARAYSAQPTNDGGYIIAGSILLDGIQKFLIAKLNSLGTIDWKNTEMESSAYSVHQTTDSGYIGIGANSGRGGPIGSGGPLIFKLDSRGALEWQKQFLGDYQYGSIQPTSDGGYIATGKTTNLWVIKLDAQGNTHWEKTFAGEATLSSTFGNFIQQTTESGFIVAGTKSFNKDGSSREKDWLLKLNAAGNLDWERTFSDHYTTQGGSSVQQTIDGGYIFLTSEEEQIKVLKLDSIGELCH